MATASNLGFEPVHKAKVFEEVAKRLQALIGEQLQPGDTLPAERELVKLFAVSRSSIREAIRTLAMLGLVEPLQGSGTVVRRIPARTLLQTSPKRAAEHTEAGDLLEARLTIEPVLARRAALQASPKDIRKLEKILSQQKCRVEQGGTAPDEDLQFHYTIALASKNDVMVRVLDVLIQMLRNTQEHRVAGRQEVEGHQRILAALMQHDASAAERAMRRHLQETEQRN